jgi:hypothetical protein
MQRKNFAIPCLKAGAIENGLLNLNPGLRAGVFEFSNQSMQAWAMEFAFLYEYFFV